MRKTPRLVFAFARSFAREPWERSMGLPFAARGRPSMLFTEARFPFMVHRMRVDSKAGVSLPEAPLATETGDAGFLRRVAAAASGERPSWDEYFMGAALLIASRSACERLNVGCVLVSGGEHRNRIIAAGYNGFLPGSPHRSRMRDGHEQATVHAEQNAIADAARRGISVDGATAYITHFPCINCAKILASAGIRHLKYLSDYRNDPVVGELLEEAGISVEKLG